jgi:surfactin synthase thioesterase subunit
MTKTPQFVRQMGAAKPRARVFCFPFAGGSPTVFNGWSKHLGEDIEVLAAHPRGRGMRFRERPDTDIPTMVAEYLSAVRLHLDLPFVFYGHSMGGLIAFELTRALAAEGLPMPVHLYVAATAPPHLGLIHEPIHHLPDAEFVDALQQRYAGIPAEVLREPDLLALFLPALKADFTAYELYQFQEAAPVGCPVTAFAGESDPRVTPGLLDQWSQHTTRPFALQQVAGGHFFLLESTAPVLAVIRQGLEIQTSSSLPSLSVTMAAEA